jgi:hypothetical protein
MITKTLTWEFQKNGVNSPSLTSEINRLIKSGCNIITVVPMSYEVLYINSYITEACIVYTEKQSN